MFNNFLYMYILIFKSHFPSKQKDKENYKKKKKFSMNKLGLQFICKNESHVVNRMLDSTKLNGKSIFDIIVVNDTGSTDNTIELIKKWGIDNNVSTYVFERKFDNFMDSRNFAMQKAKNTIIDLGWDPNLTFFTFIDCDEQFVINSNFDRNQFNKDLYMMNTYIGTMKYTRNSWVRILKAVWTGEDAEKFLRGETTSEDAKSCGLFVTGVVHEFIAATDPSITSGLAENIHVNVQMDGNSWQSGNIADKYKKHAAILEDYIDNKNRDPRWVFYLGQSYHDSATIPNNKTENDERLRRSLKYYRERVGMTHGYEEERYYSQYRIGTIMRALEEPWMETHKELLKAYSMDPLRGESLKIIIDYYLSVNEWHMAYLYSKFCKVNFHNKNPYPTRLLFVDESLYTWKFLEVHSAASFYINRKDEARSNFLELQEVIKKSPNSFNPNEIAKINSNAQFFR